MEEQIEALVKKIDFMVSSQSDITKRLAKLEKEKEKAVDPESVTGASEILTEEIEEIEEENDEEAKFDTGFKSLLNRLVDSILDTTGGGSSAHVSRRRKHDEPGVPRSSKKDRPTMIRSKDLKWEYEALRDSVARLKLPHDYRMNDSRTGIS